MCIVGGVLLVCIFRDVLGGSIVVVALSWSGDWIREVEDVFIGIALVEMTWKV